MTAEQQRHILAIKQETKKISEKLQNEAKRLEAEREAMLKAQDELLAKLASKIQKNDSEDDDSEEDETVPVKTVVKQLTTWDERENSSEKKNTSAGSDKKPYVTTVTKSIKKYRF